MRGMPREGPRGPKFPLLGRFGPKRVLQTRSELASRLHASDYQKGRSVFSLRRGACPGGAPEDLNVNCLVESGPNKVCRLAASWRVNLRAADDQKKKVGIFVKTRRMPREGPRGPKRDLLGRIGPKKVLQTRRELARRLRASDDQKRKVGIFVKTRRMPKRGPQAA